MQYVAIQSKDTEAILKVIADYYRQFKLTLEEIAIGERQSKYITADKRFPNIEAYRRSIGYGNEIRRSQISTYFDFYENLAENSDYVVFEFFDYQLVYALSADEQLLEELSKKLKKRVILYDYVDSTASFHIASYENGLLNDEIYYEGSIRYSSGWFKQYEKNRYNSLGTFEKNAVIPYFKIIKFNFQTEELHIFDEKKWRRFFLNGEPSVIKDFLRMQRFGSLELNPLKWPSMK